MLSAESSAAKKARRADQRLIGNWYATACSDVTLISKGHC